MKSSALTAFVLHGYDWSDSSLVLDCFSREQGRLAVVAKGAKRPTSQLRAVLLPMQRISLHLTRHKGAEAPEIHTLRSAEWMASHPLPQRGALLAGYYLNELLMRLLPRAQPIPLLFDAYAATLAGLALATEAVEAPELWLRAFELRLLAALGWLPELTHDSVSQSALKGEGAYTLAPELGLVAAEPGAAALTGAQWLRLHQSLQSGVLSTVELLAGGPSRGALKVVLRQVLQYHLGHQPLRSRSVLHQAHALLDSPP